MLLKKFNPKNYDDFAKKFIVPNCKNFNFAYDVFEKLVQKNPKDLCLRHVNNEFIVQDYTFQQMWEASNRVANFLTKLGIKKGDKVILILFRSIQWWECLLALQKIGAVAIPAPAQLTGEDIVFRANAAEASAVITEDSVAEIIEEVRAKCKTLEIFIETNNLKTEKTIFENWHNYHKLFNESEINYPKPQGENYASDDDPLLVFFSSGTTGMPKMVAHNHKYPLGHFFTGVYWHNLNKGDVHLTVADTGWAKATWGKSFGQWMAGAAVFVYDYRGKFEAKDLLKVISENGVTSFCSPPTIYRFLVREDLTKYNLSAIKHFTTAGELLNASVFETWKKITGLPIYEGFGQSESTIQIATLNFMEPKPGSIGKPVPGWDVCLLNDDGAPSLTGEEGEICVRISEKKPFGLFTQYLNNEEKTLEAMNNGWYHTGDKAWMDEDGYFWFLGRFDDLIKTSGYRVGPFEVESALVAHPAVIEAAVIGVPDEVRGQSIKASVILAEGYEASEELTLILQQHVKKLTAPYKYPRKIEYVESLPKTVSGKIKRAEMRQQNKDNS